MKKCISETVTLLLMQGYCIPDTDTLRKAYNRERRMFGAVNPYSLQQYVITNKICYR